jgi:bifunctional non-homologous end joining protein LigD
VQSESVSLFFKEGSSDKEYHAQLESHDDGWIVSFQYGRRGSALRADSKTPHALPYEEAKKIYDKVVREKLGKGYRPLGETLPAPIGQAGERRKTNLACELLTAIELSEVAKYVLGRDYWLQDKRDGQRRMVQRRRDGAILGVNRRGITVPLPARLHAELKCIAWQTFVLDGEIEEDRLVVFDLLDADGDLRNERYADRFDRLLLELSRARFPSGRELEHISAVSTWRTREEKEAGLQKLYEEKAEGVVFKRAGAAYAPGRSGSHLKFKFTATCSARVRTVNKKRSVGLELLDGNATWIDIGNVSVPVSHEIPRVGSLVEARYLYATSGRHLYQPVYLGLRTDIGEEECTLAQLKFKKDEEDL